MGLEITNREMEFVNVAANLFSIYYCMHMLELFVRGIINRNINGLDFMWLYNKATIPIIA